MKIADGERRPVQIANALRRRAVSQKEREGIYRLQFTV
jgi:hypothetical protein